MTKAFVLIVLTLFAADAYADKLACTTGLTLWKGAVKPKPKICGAVSANDVKDDGVKTRRRPRFCKDYTVEFMSIRKGDKPGLRALCGRNVPSCYVIRISDSGKRQGMTSLSSYLVFANVQSIPTRFGLGAGGVGYKSKLLQPTLARRVQLDLSCRKTR
jgi:hypothetical protein